MSELRFRVAFADVDPYLIHWSAYPALMDRGASAVLIPPVSPEWLRAGHHLGVHAFRCTFERPVSVGHELVLRSDPHAVAPDRVRVQHTFEDVGGRVAAGVTEHVATAAGNGWTPVPLPGGDGFAEAAAAGDVPGEDEAPVEWRHVAALVRTVHLRQVDTASLHWLAWLEWVDEGTCALFAARGHPVSRLYAAGTGFPLAAAEGRLRPGVGMDDEVTVESAVERVGRTSLRLGHRLLDPSGRRVGWARTSHVCVTRERFRPVPVPDWLR